MADESVKRESNAVPEAEVVRTPRSFSTAWIVTLLIAAGAIAFIAWQTRQATGPRIEITFADAEGLEVGAPIVHLGTRVGVVRAVELTDDLTGVRVRAELQPHAAGLAREGSRFWIVRPEVSLRGVSGLDALLGPRYVAVRPAPGDAPRADAFLGIDGPPADAPGSGGLELELWADQLGDVAPGAPVLYRGVRVGRVTRTGLSNDATHAEIRVVIDRAYSPLVRANSRFWNAGGVGVDFGFFRGLSVEAGSLDTLVEGAIAFATPNAPGERVGQGTVFSLASEGKDAWLEWQPTIPNQVDE